MMTVLDTRPTYASATIARVKAQDRRRKFLPLFLLVPTGLLFALLFACAMVVLRISFGVKNAEWTDWSLSAYIGLIDPLYARVFLKTFLLACAGAIISVIIGFPLAFYMARTTSATKRRAVLLCTMLPMLVSLLVQSYGWMAILGPDGMLNRILMSLTGVPRMTAFLFNDTGVLLGLVQTALPLAVFPIANGLATIPQDLEEAAAILGASRRDTYREVILPIAWPSIVSAALLVFAFNAGAFAVPMLLGGLKVTTAALIIRDHMGPLLDWPFGSALSVGLIFAVFAVLLSRRLFVLDRSSIS